MNKIITITAATVLSFGGFSASAWAHEEEENVQDEETVYEPRGAHPNDDRPSYDQRHDGSGRLQREVDHLNRMMNHVREEMRAYGAGRRIRSQYEHLRAEAYQLNNQFRRGDQYYDRRRLRDQIEHMHAELHQIEVNLHVRANGYYQWR